MTYGDRLRTARKHKKMSQEDLFYKSGVGQGSISKIERGDQNSSAFDIELARALDISPYWLKKGCAKEAPNWLKVGSNNVTEIPLNKYGNIETENSRMDIKKFVSQVQVLRLKKDDIDLFLANKIGINVEMIDVLEEINNKTFAIKIESERFKAVAPIGRHILFDPNLKPSHGNIVLVSFKNDDNCHLMFYTVIAGHIHLKPVEEGLQQIDFTPDAKILAVGFKSVIYIANDIL